MLLIALSFVLGACALAVTADSAKQVLAPINADLEKILTDARVILTELAQLPEARGNDTAACTAVIAERIKPHVEYTALGAAHLDGNLFCTSQVQTAPVSIGDRAYFQRAVESKDLSVGEYQIGRVTNKAAFGLGYPLLDNSGSPQGIVLAPIDLDWLNRRIAGMKLPEGSEVVILDSKGDVLVHTPAYETWLGKSVGDTTLGKAMLAQVDGTGEMAGLDGVVRMYAYTSPKGSNKNLLVAVGVKR